MSKYDLRVSSKYDDEEAGWIIKLVLYRKNPKNYLMLVFCKRMDLIFLWHEDKTKDGTRIKKLIEKDKRKGEGGKHSSAWDLSGTEEFLPDVFKEAIDAWNHKCFTNFLFQYNVRAQFDRSLNEFLERCETYFK